MMRAIFLVPLGLIFLVGFDLGYFDSLQKDADGGSISEGFIRKGGLGKLLRDGGYLGISADSGKAVSDNLCAPDSVLRGYDRHDLFRLRVSVQSFYEQDLRIAIQDSRTPDTFIAEERIRIFPRKESYSVYFNVAKGTPLTVTFSTSTRLKEPLYVGRIAIDGQFGREQLLFESKQAIHGAFSESTRFAGNNINGRYSGALLDKPGMHISYSLPGGVPGFMYAGTFPGKKNQGFCRYSAVTQTQSERDPLNRLIPNVELEVAEEYLSGEELGIISHRESKGRAWEVPAKLTLDNGEERYTQTVGLRTHGGTKGRELDIESYRVYARRGYGKRSLEGELLFDPVGEASLEALVLKYTYQVYGYVRKEFNPFIHALGLEVANRVGALVPRHQLVNFEMNGESKGLYLAMEHLSKRTVKNWLGRDDFISYIYKKYNPPHVKDSFHLLLAQITAEEGDASLAMLERFYDVDNVINSIVLSSYIADDDYCQGMEVIDNLDNLSEAKITSINWDLDHGFLVFEDRKFITTPERPAFWLLEPSLKSACPRRWMYAYVYAQSPKFRELLRNRFQEVLSNSLSISGMQPLMDYYHKINQHYYQGRHTKALNDIENFIEKRGQIIFRQLDALELRAEAGGIQPVYKKPSES